MFTEWYRSTLNRDGRVVWWEHAYAFVPIPSSIGLWGTRYFQSLWPFAILTLLGAVFAVWSWRQDLIVHDTDVADGPNTVRDREAKVPLVTKLYAIGTVLLLIFIIVNWFRTGHY